MLKLLAKSVLTCVFLIHVAFAQTVQLTEDEKRWIDNAPVIKTNNSSGNAPFDFIENGAPAGYSIEYLQLLGDKVGLSFEFVQGKTWSEYKQFAEDRHIDLLHLVSKSEDRKRYLNYTQSYFTGSPSLLYAKKSKALISSYTQLGSKKVSVLRDTVDQRLLSQLYPDVQLQGVDSIHQGVNSILKGDSDYFLCYPSICDTYLSSRFLSLVESRGHLGIAEIAEPKQAYFAVRKDWPELVSILNKAISSVTPEEKRRLADKWVNQQQSLPLEKGLSEEEQLWLDNNKRLIYSQPTKYSPYSYVEEDGTMGGLAADLVKELNIKYDVGSYYVDYPNWTETYQALLEGEIDFIPTININEKRKQEVLLSNPVLTYYLTIFSHDDGPVFSSLDELAGYRIGVSKNSSVARLLQKNYPDLNYVTYKNGVDAYKALDRGDVDATATSPHVMSQTISEHGLEQALLPKSVEPFPSPVI
ncbi:transporter substrate-binding domain-containing protein [Vibrio sp. OPT18]|uniref:transporter substrate-binding domain-containing protein n=1 Tax=Vibrio sp. OPT18 TaxID=2778641 RepID=UPI00188040F5|nr:transporter substrate-binding domain-containing protein [Vibrio sp. OPT18]MBE8577437.1 transporter substrate-binding domain-containing protein [Vibrio sp. OPT18]